MKPFNLNDFKAGKKVVTRDGREVKQLTVFDCEKSRMVGVVDNNMFIWDNTGGLAHCNDSHLDLFHPDPEIMVVFKTVRFGLGLPDFFVNSIHRDYTDIPTGTYKLVKVD